MKTMHIDALYYIYEFQMKSWPCIKMAYIGAPKFQYPSEKSSVYTTKGLYWCTRPNRHLVY